MSQPLLTGRDKRMAVWSYNALWGSYRWSLAFTHNVQHHPLTSDAARAQAAVVEHELHKLGALLKTRGDQL